MEWAGLFIWNSFPPSPLCIGMKTIELKCPECETPFHRPLKEHRRSLKLKRQEFCSGTCSTTHRNRELLPEDYERCYKIKKHAGNRLDEFSSFRSYLSKGRASIKAHRNELDVSYLKELWESQRGICPYTGIKMILPKTTYDKVRSPIKASLDRIDSNREYVKGNVEFVCCAINLAKNSFTREQMKEFLREIVVEPPGVEPGC